VNFNEEFDMLFMADTDVTPVPVYVSARSVDQEKTASLRKMKYGICKFATPYTNEQHSGSETYLGIDQFLYGFLPVDLQDSLRKPSSLNEDKVESVDRWTESLTVKVVRQPLHGILRADSKGVEGVYFASQGYIGKDRIDYLIEGKDYQGRPLSLTIVYYINVPTLNEFRYSANTKQSYKEALKRHCGTPLSEWRISQTGSILGDLVNANLTQQADELGAWQRASTLSALLANASQFLSGFIDLASTAVGETVGQGLSAQITLDTNAAGHGWYINPTPLDNTDEYLPTSDATVWQAKAGSAAAGKMDMLSVLLHEYGHALGLEHSGDGADFMAASLQPGVRKLPSSEELALMGQLVAQLKAEQGAALTPALSQGERGQEPLNPFGHA
jgi:Matrixin